MSNVIPVGFRFLEIARKRFIEERDGGILSVQIANDFVEAIEAYAEHFGHEKAAESLQAEWHKYAGITDIGA